MKTCLNFCKVNDNYMITEKFTNKSLVIIKNKKISIVDIFNSIFVNYVVSHETCNLEIENTVTDDEEANKIFIQIKNLLAEISSDVNNYLNSMLAQI